MPSHPIERFDALLRELARFGLVVRDEGATGIPWALSTEAQTRLGELLMRNDQKVLPEELVYLSHKCADCHRRGLTRLREGRYLCERCAGGTQTPAEVIAPSAAS